MRQQLRPTLLVAFFLVLLHLVIDVANRAGAHAGDLGIYAILLFVPLVGFALTYLPSQRLAVHDIAVVFDLTFTLGILAFSFDPGSTLSAVTVALCLKMLATAVLLPWHPAQQLRSALMTLALYGATVWLSGRPAPETHQIVAPLLAGILATYACRRLDRTHRDLHRHSAELEASERQLRAALAQDRVLLGVANATNALTDLRSVLARLNRATAEASGATFSTTFLAHDSDDTLELASTYAFEGSLTHPLGTRFPAWSGSNLQRAMALGQTVYFDDIRKQDLIPPALLEAADVQVIAFCPIVNHGRLLGVLTAGRLKGSPGFTNREAAILSGIAAHAAVTISNARLYDELTASEAAYRDLFERANDLIFVADVDGAIHFANQAALAFFDTAPGDLPNVRWTRFLDAPELDRVRRRRKVARRMDDRGADAFDVSIVRPRRGGAILEVRARLISPPGQSPERFQCIARDVTERSRRDEETRALLTRLQESQQLQDEFVANMSHELRTPLNVIIGYADLLADDLHMPLHSDARSFLDRIGAASRALHRMVESILEYARLDRGRMMVIPTNFSSDHLLLELEGLCNDVRSGFHVTLELTQTGTIEFVTDYDRLYSILSNLLLNALKFTPKG